MTDLAIDFLIATSVFSFISGILIHNLSEKRSGWGVFICIVTVILAILFLAEISEKTSDIPTLAAALVAIAADVTLCGFIGNSLAKGVIKTTPR